MNNLILMCGWFFISGMDLAVFGIKREKYYLIQGILALMLGIWDAYKFIAII
jgi:hypothetical protein